MAQSMQITYDIKGENTGTIKRRRIVAYIVLGFLSLLCLFWFYLLFVNATKSHAELSLGFTAIPSTHLFTNWKQLMKMPLKVLPGLANSILVAAFSAICATYFSAMTAYAIHVYRFAGRKAIATFILAVMMIPTQVTALGFLELIRKFNMMDTFWPLIIPSIAAPATFFYMKQYLDSALPLEIVEAARIDGSGEFRTYNTIIMPIVKPAIAVQAIFTFVASWNNYFTPALILSNENRKTLPILIAQLRSMDWSHLDMGAVYVMIAFSIFPVVVVYLCLSKYIVGGIAAGSVKG